MENSVRFGLMAVFAVSGSMVLLVHQVHKRLLSNFMKKFEFEMGDVLNSHPHKHHFNGSEKHQGKKKVRFAADVMEFPLESKGQHHHGNARRPENEVLVTERVQGWRRGPKLEDIMPPNRAVLYKGIMNYKILKDPLRL